MKTLLLPICLTLVACGMPESSDGPYTPSKNASADRVYFRVGSVKGTFGGNTENVLNPSWVEHQSTAICTYESTGSSANQNPFLGDPVHDTYMKSLSVTGVSRCPSAGATSSKDPSCSSEPVVFDKKLMVIDIHLAGWSDDAVVTFNARAPGGPMPCNFASLVKDGPNTTWGLETRTTLKEFRSGKPFEVRFLGMGTVKEVSSTSNVLWDFTVVFEPTK